MQYNNLFSPNIFSFWISLTNSIIEHSFYQNSVGILYLSNEVSQPFEWDSARPKFIDESLPKPTPTHSKLPFLGVSRSLRSFSRILCGRKVGVGHGLLLTLHGLYTSHLVYFNKLLDNVNGELWWYSGYHTYSDQE